MSCFICGKKLHDEPFIKLESKVYIPNKHNGHTEHAFYTDDCSCKITICMDCYTARTGKDRYT